MENPHDGWFVVETPIRIDDLGVPPFEEISIWETSWEYFPIAVVYPLTFCLVPEANPTAESILKQPHQNDKMMLIFEAISLMT